jgi:hypothetical protein
MEEKIYFRKYFKYMWLSYSPLKYSMEGFDFRSVSTGRTAQKRCDVGSGLNAALCL